MKNKLLVSYVILLITYNVHASKKIEQHTGSIIGDHNIIQNGEINKVTIIHKGKSKKEIEKIVSIVLKKYRADNNEQIKKAVSEAITALNKGQGIVASESELSTAVAELAKGNTEQAKALFSKTAKRTEQQVKQGAEALRNLGALAFLDNPQEALQAYRRATELEPDNAEGWNQLGQLLSRGGDLSEAIAAYNKVLILGEEKEIAFAYTNLGIVYEIQGDIDKAIEFQQRALKLNESMGNKEGMAQNYGNLGNIYETQQDIDKTIGFYQEALKISESIGNKEGMANNYGNLGIVYKDIGNLDKAIEFQQRALKLNESMGNKEGIATNYGNLGIIYKDLDDKDKAIEFYQKALILNESLGRKVGMASNYSNLGVIYDMRGDLDKAVGFYQKASKLNENLGRKEGMAINYANLGTLYEKQGNKTEAKHFYQKSIELFKQLNSPNAQTVQALLDAL